MSRQESTPSTSNLTVMIGMIATIIIVGSTVMYISMSSPEVAEKVAIFFDEHGCGEGTFYHESTNSCELYPEVKQKLDNQDVIDDLDRVIRDIRLDVDGHRIVDRDADGLPVVSCTPFEGKTFSIDENCQMTEK